MTFFFSFLTCPKLDAFASARILEVFNKKFDDIELAEEEKEYEDNVIAVRKQLRHYAEKGGRTGIVRKAKAAGPASSVAPAATPQPKGKGKGKGRKRSLSKSREEASSRPSEAEEEQPQEEAEEEEPEVSLRSRKRPKGMLHSSILVNSV